MSSERTEKPTSKRLKDAKKRGQVARSRDFGDALHLGIALLVLAWWGNSMLRGLGVAMQEALSRMGQSPLRSVTGGEVVSLAVHGIWQLSWLVGPVALGALVSTAVATQAQGGFNLATEGLRLDLTRLNPANGLKKLAPSKAGLDLVKTELVSGIMVENGKVTVAIDLPETNQFAGVIRQEVMEKIEPLWDVKEVEVRFTK